MCKKHAIVRKVTYNNITRRMHFACRVTKKRIETPISNIRYLLLFPGNNGYVEAPEYYVMPTLPLLVVITAECVDCCLVGCDDV